MNQIILDAQTQYNGSGLQKAVGGLKGLETEVKNANNAAEGTGVTFDGLVSKMGKPLGRTTFRMLAADVLMSQGALNGATGASEGLAAVMRSVGVAAIYAGGTFAGISIAVIGVIEVFRRLNSMGDMTAENVEKISKASYEQKKKYDESAESLRKAGIISNQEVGILKNLSNASQKEIDDLEKKLKLRAEHDQLIMKLNKDEKEYVDTTGMGLTITRKYDLAQQDLVKTTKALSGLNEYMKTQQADKDKALEESTNAEKRQLDTQSRIVEENSKALHDSINKTVKTILSMEKSFNESFAKMYVESHGNYLKSLRAGAAEEINIIADQEASKLELRALADVFFNPIKAVAEFAGATALRTFGAGVSSRFGAGSGGASTGGTSIGSVSPGSTATVSNPTDNRSPVTIHVQVMGNLVDHKQFLVDLQKQMNDMVENGGMRVVATDLKTTGRGI